MPVHPRPIFSIITVVRNRKDNILENLRSVDSQTYSKNIEHIIIDGASDDGTLEAIRSYKSSSAVNRRVFSEPDAGIYDALNKGFSAVKGDFVGILHSDDIFFDQNVVEDLVTVFEDKGVDLVYSNVNLVGTLGEYRGTIRPRNRAKRFLFPDQVSHMGLFMSAEVAQYLVPPFDVSYRIAADVKHQLILLDHSGFKSEYYDRIVVTFRIGGVSTQSFRYKALGVRESIRAWNEVNGFGGTAFVAIKVLRNIFSRHFR